MTGSNSAKQTLEERVVQKIKSDTLLAVIGDEDAILELAQRAVREALYQPQRFSEGYGRTAERDSIAVETARSVAKAAAERAVSSLIDEIAADPKIVAAMREMIAKTMPVAVVGLVRDSMREQIEMTARDAAMQISNMIQNR